MNKTGFGFLRLPRLDPADEKSVDYGLLNAMVDRFLALGGAYFDTAYTYLGGVSEEALHRSVVERYPRERLRIADKLPGYMAKTPEDSRRFLEESLRRCGVTYFDVYLLHGLNGENYQIAGELDQFAFLARAKEEGIVRRIGFSYHDSPELLDRILTEHPEVDVVQLQINYLDWESPSIQSRACYETAARHGKPVIVMEPVKGGTLAAVPDAALGILREMEPEASPASWAIRFASGLDRVETVLSGMNTMGQMEENMAPVRPLTPGELAMLQRAAEVIRSGTAVSCTGCGYCVPECPVGMPIPGYLSLYNECARNPGEEWKFEYRYQELSARGARASECVRCGCCAGRCPQRIGIGDWLRKLAELFEERNR